MDPTTITKKWVQHFVIAHGLCPFAASPFRQDRIRYVELESDAEEDLISLLVQELHRLRDTPADTVETTLIIHPKVLTDFQAYNQFLSVTDAILEGHSLDGVIQIASFHPDYRFEGAAPDAVENFVARAPFPMLHLLREDSISIATDTYPAIHQIPDRKSVV